MRVLYLMNEDQLPKTLIEFRNMEGPSWQPLLLGASFLCLVGWRPWALLPTAPPSTLTPAQQSAPCEGVPAASRPPELLLQRKHFTPSPAPLSLPASADALRLREELSLAASAPCTAAAVRPYLPNQELHVGSLLQSLVPLLWLGLNSSTEAGSSAAAAAYLVQMPALTSIDRRDARCPSQSLGCFLRPLSSCPPPPPGSAAADAQHFRTLAAVGGRGRGKGKGKGGGKGKGKGKGGGKGRGGGGGGGGGDARGGVAAEKVVVSKAPAGEAFDVFRRLSVGSGAARASISRNGASIVRLMRVMRDATTPAGFEYSTGLDGALPARYRAHGLFWLVSHTVAFVMRPTAALAAAIRRARRQLGLLRAGGDRGDRGDRGGEGDDEGDGGGAGAAATCSPRQTLGVHVRRAEACAPYVVYGRRRSCTPLATYAAQAKQLVAQSRQQGPGQQHQGPEQQQQQQQRSARGGRSNGNAAAALRCVLIVTDSEEVARNASAAFAPLRVMVRVTPTLTARVGVGVDGYDAIEALLVDAHLLSRCAALVAKFSSSVSRLAYSLMFARRDRRADNGGGKGGGKGGGGGGGGGDDDEYDDEVGVPCDCLRPFVSLDMPWCFGRSCRKAGNVALKEALRRAPRAKQAAATLAAPAPPPSKRAATASARDERAAARAAAHTRAVKLARLVRGVGTEKE